MTAILMYDVKFRDMLDMPLGSFFPLQISIFLSITENEIFLNKFLRMS